MRPKLTSHMDGEQWIPPTKSRQPGTVKSASPQGTVTSEAAEGSDHSSEVGHAKWIGFDKGKQLQTKDTGLHIQP